jgi:HSP20 family protein
MFFVSATRSSVQAWQPRVDVYHTPDGFLVKLELAGVNPNDIHLTVENSYLRVRGSRRDEHCCGCTGCHCMEIAYSEFERVVELPASSSSAEVRTSYVDGMLLVRIITREQA